MHTPSDFDRTWAGPEELKPKIYRRQIEKDIWYGCVVENEYELSDLQPGDAVIDIGAHIGAFSWLAHRKGSRRIWAFEADPWHIEAGEVNLAGLGVHYIHMAVVRGDSKRALAYHYNGNWNVWQDEGERVPSISLDDVLSWLSPEVRFLKIDCEGSEWPILYTCTKLKQIQEIAGEFHTRRFGQLDYPELEGLPPCEIATLAEYFTDLGFDFRHTPENEGGTGLFHANRI